MGRVVILIIFFTLYYSLLNGSSCYWMAAYVMEWQLMLLNVSLCCGMAAHVIELQIMLWNGSSCYEMAAHVIEWHLMLWNGSLIIGNTIFLFSIRCTLLMIWYGSETTEPGSLDSFYLVATKVSCYKLYWNMYSMDLTPPHTH